MIQFGPVTDEMITHDEAVLYCQFLEHNGHTDWRMPTCDEYLQHDIISGWAEGDIPLGYAVVFPVRDI